MSFRSTTRAAALPASIFLFVIGCADRSTPTASEPTALTQLSAAASLSAVQPRHLVHFSGEAVPETFAASAAALGATVDAAYDALGIAVVSGLSDTAAAQLAASAGVTDVDPDNVFQFLEPTLTATTDATTADQASTNPTAAAFYPFQWHLRAIGADAAWAAGKLGSPSVKVAILDTGIDYLHPDLAGLVDLANSASFVPAEDPFVPALFPGRLAFTDMHYHGTHVAATVSSNAVVAAGVSAKTSLMAIKVLDINGSGTTSAILAGLVFATDRGADVINMSLGIRDLLSRKDKEVREFKRMTDRVFRYAHRRGVMVIASAGNEAQNLDTKLTFKAYCGSAHVTCVSATGPTSQTSVVGPWQNIDAPSSYTNFGVKRIDVAAPGGNGTSFVWAACSTTSLRIPPCRTALLGLGLQGTSQAAPHASGVAALILSKWRLGPVMLREVLLRSADDLGPRGRDPFYGRGRINVSKALGL